MELGGTRVADAGLKHLEQMMDLRSLRIHGTLVTDAGLVHVARLPSLQEVELGGTRVTGTGLRELQKALPNLTIKD